jgi:hypothetical protein
MKKTLLLIFTCFFFTVISQAQSERTEENAVELPYFQNDKVIQKNKIEVYPNPAVENIYVKIENSELEKVEFELFNIIGNSLGIQPEEISKNNFKIKIEEFPAGYYLLIVKDPITRFNQAFKFHVVK